MKNIAVRILALILAAAAVFSLLSCEQQLPQPKSKELSFIYFNTESVLYDYSGSSSEDFAALCADVKKSLQNYHQLYDIYNDYDGVVNLKTVNDNAGAGPIKVDKKIIDMLLFSKEMYALTGGEVNIAMGAVLKLWHDCRVEAKEAEKNGHPEAARIPDMSELILASEHTDINNLIIDEENLTVELLDEEMSLDVGAIAKGYAVEMLARELEERGLSGYVIDVGRNLRAIGTKRDGSGWKTGVKNPSGEGSSYVYYHELKNEAIVTSGVYERCYTVAGVSYHHIINGETLMPENNYLSVTIISDNSAFSDALSTAVFNMEYSEAEQFAKSLDAVKIILVLNNGEIKELN